MVDKEIPQLDVAGSIPVARSNQDEGVTGPPRSPSLSRLQITQSVSDAAGQRKQSCGFSASVQ